jgi:putative endonuclease
MRRLFQRSGLGPRGERIAARRLRRQGYRILGRNLRLGRYELDLVARKGDTVAFVEVKTRAPDGLAPPEANVTPRKQRHIRSAAKVWLDRNDNGQTYYRFDVVTVVVHGKGRADVTHLPDAFRG